MNLIVDVKRKLTVVKYAMKTYYQFSNNEYRPAYVDVKTDFCASQAGLLSSPMQNLLKKMWGNNTNIFTKCPLLPGVYYTKDWNFDANHLPNIMPAGRYLLNTSISVQFDDVLMNSSIYFHIANNGILDLNMG